MKEGTGEIESTVGFDPASLDFDQQYKLLGGAVVPRPIALVTTLGEAGANAAPFSYFNAIGQLPPMIIFSIGPKPGTIKDTLRNLRALPELVVHIVDDANIRKMNLCAVEYASDVNEMERAGFRTAPSLRVKPPRIIDCPAQLECRVMQILELGQVPYYLVVAEVVYFHFHRDVVNERLHVDFEKLNPVGRIAGNGRYVRITDNFSLNVPPVSEAP